MNYTNQLINNNCSCCAKFRTRGSELPSQFTAKLPVPTYRTFHTPRGGYVCALRRVETRKNGKETARLVTDTCLWRI